MYGAPETAAAAERYNRKVRKIDGVICVAADAPLTVAAVAERLGLSGISTATAELASDKLRMKERFAAKGVPVPWFAEVATPQALQRFAIERGSNLVIKPADSRGSRGVQRVAQVQDLTKAFMLARSHSPSERVMVEQYLDGPTVSTGIDRRERSDAYTPGFSGPQLRISGTLCAVLHRERRRLAQPSLAPEIQEKVSATLFRLLRRSASPERYS